MGKLQVGASEIRTTEIDGIEQTKTQNFPANQGEGLISGENITSDQHDQAAEEVKGRKSPRRTDREIKNDAVKEEEEKDTGHRSSPIRISPMKNDIEEENHLGGGTTDAEYPKDSDDLADGEMNSTARKNKNSKKTDIEQVI